MYLMRRGSQQYPVAFSGSACCHMIMSDGPPVIGFMAQCQAADPCVCTGIGTPMDLSSSPAQPAPVVHRCRNAMQCRRPDHICK